jgi:hypothetical protein
MTTVTSTQSKQSYTENMRKRPSFKTSVLNIITISCSGNGWCSKAAVDRPEADLTHHDISTVPTVVYTTHRDGSRPFDHECWKVSL